MTTKRRTNVRILMALAVLYVVWSSTYFALRIVVVAMPPLASSGARFFIAGLALLIFSLLRGSAVPKFREWLLAFPSGFLLFAGGNGLVALAERSASSGSAALACALAPVWAAVFAWVSGERHGLRRWLGFVLGITGVAVLCAGGSMPNRHAAIELAIAPICWASGTLLARKLSSRSSHSAALQLIMGGAATVVLGVVMGESFPTHVTRSGVVAWFYLVVFGSMIAFSAYAYLVREAPTQLAMSYAYVNPVLAVILGAAFGAERLGADVVLAGLLVVPAVFLIAKQPATRAR